MHSQKQQVSNEQQQAGVRKKGLASFTRETVLELELDSVNSERKKKKKHVKQVKYNSGKKIFSWQH